MKEIRAMFIGAHPDDCDIRCGGLALKYARAGHKVKFLSLCNGNGGHYSLSPDELAKRCGRLLPLPTLHKRNLYRNHRIILDRLLTLHFIGYIINRVN